MKKFAGGTPSVNCVQIPSNRASTLEVFVAEQVEAVTADLFCLVDDFFDSARNPLPQERKDWID
jgi:hypothetical protein